MVDNLLHIAKTNASRNLAMHFDFRNPITRPKYERYLKQKVFKQHCINSRSLLKGCVVKGDNVEIKTQLKEIETAKKRAVIAEGELENTILVVPKLEDIALLRRFMEGNLYPKNEM